MNYLKKCISFFIIFAFLVLLIPKNALAVVADQSKSQNQVQKQVKSQIHQEDQEQVQEQSQEQVQEKLGNQNAVKAKVGHDLIFTKKHLGKLFLQVQQGGEIWYVSPKDNKRYRITIQNALRLFRKLAHGIKTVDLEKIPYGAKGLSDKVDSDEDGYSDRAEAMNGYNPYGRGRLNYHRQLAMRMAGKLLLQVDDHGRIWYVDLNGERYEVTHDNIMEIFKLLSIGITDNDLDKIEEGDL